MCLGFKLELVCWCISDFVALIGSICTIKCEALLVLLVTIILQFKVKQQFSFFFLNNCSTIFTVVVYLLIFALESNFIMHTFHLFFLTVPFIFYSGGLL